MKRRDRQKLIVLKDIAEAYLTPEDERTEWQTELTAGAICSAVDWDYHCSERQSLDMDAVDEILEEIYLHYRATPKKAVYGYGYLLDTTPKNESIRGDFCLHLIEYLKNEIEYSENKKCTKGADGNKG